MFLPLSVLIQCIKTSHLQCSNPANRLALARPQSHHLTPYSEFFTHLRLLRKILSQSLHLALFQTEHRVASAAFCIYSLSLLD
jgi:hypothetical protein